MQCCDFQQLRGKLVRNYSLARHTSWRIGGDAERLYWPSDIKDLQVFLQQLPKEESLTWLGLGSNVLIRDGGVVGTVIITLNRLNAISLISDTQVRVEAGVTCAKMAKFCVKHHFSDGAFFAGIPGTIGGALAMNAGAFGGETWRFVEYVELIDRQGKITRKQATEFEVGYRSVQRLHEEYFVAACFNFSIRPKEQVKSTITQLLKKRSETQPVGEYNCGSVFKNPPNDYAARLIESVGLKGFRIGAAEVSSKHANFICNVGHATSKDVERLMALIVKRVYDVHRITLVPEVQVIGKYHEKE